MESTQVHFCAYYAFLWYYVVHQVFIYTAATLSEENDVTNSILSVGIGSALGVSGMPAYIVAKIKD